MKRKTSLWFLAGLTATFVLLFSGCQKEGGRRTPVITTVEVTEITHNSAISGGLITDTGGSRIVALGLCWSTSDEPTVDDNYIAIGEYTHEGIITEEFTQAITGLEGETQYYVRAYAANESGIAYGETLSFMTDQSGMIIHTLTAEMIETFTQESSEGPKENLVDGNTSTYWHSAWSSNVAPLPHWIQITFPNETAIGGFSYTHRIPSGASGRPNHFDVQVSDDQETWTTVWESDPDLPVDPVDEEVTLLFGQNYVSKYFRIRILGTPGNTSHTYLSTITVFEARM